ncbi:MAG: SDR family oxidoreductase [Gaiellaceae bacterium]
MIVVTGSTGHVGRLVAEELFERGEQFRLLVRDPARAPELPGHEAVAADYGRPDLLAEALQEGDRVFMVSLHEGPDRRVPLHRSFVDAAARAGVSQIVYLSFANAGRDATFLHARSHGDTEEILADSGVPWKSIRNTMYADHIPGWFDPDGIAREPLGDARMSFSYRPELAKAIVAVLTGPGHAEQVYDITTPESVSLHDLAHIAAEVTGDPYRYEPASDEEWDERWRALGRSGWELEAGHTSYEAIRNGELDVVTDDYRRLTGLEPLTVYEIVERHADELPLS